VSELAATLAHDERDEILIMARRRRLIGARA
jgi:hypothetical protein